VPEFPDCLSSTFISERHFDEDWSLSAGKVLTRIKGPLTAVKTLIVDQLAAASTITLAQLSGSRECPARRHNARADEIPAESSASAGY
jgi:hypothetical protein